MIDKPMTDCDAGQDGAIMWPLSMAWPGRFRLLGITTVAGNARLMVGPLNGSLAQYGN
jgi:inosine-uridine nucleoside N-ribohydrolase